MLDHGTAVFIWLGASGALPGGWNRAVLEAAAQGFVAGLAEGRFPVPEVRVALEVSIMKPCLSNPCRYEPLHTLSS